MVFAVDGKPAVFIARHAGRPSFIELVLTLDDFALRRGHVGSKRKQKTAGDTLLHGNTRARIGVVST